MCIYPYPPRPPAPFLKYSPLFRRKKVAVAWSVLESSCRRWDLRENLFSGKLEKVETVCKRLEGKHLEWVQSSLCRPALV